MFRYRSSFVVALTMVLFLGTCFFLLNSCARPYQKKVENIVRIFMHEPGNYSFIIQLPNSNTATIQTFNLGNWCEVRFIIDVPENEKMWAYVQRKFIQGKGDAHFLDLHIHSVNNIEGGGWDHGKFGRGQTQVIR